MRDDATVSPLSSSDTHMPMLALRGVGKRFGGVVALRDATFEVGRGEIHALMGENGAGKSTLIKILTGQYSDFSGQISVEGQAFLPHGPRDARDRFGIGCIHQELSLIPDLSIAENLFLAREPRTRTGMVDFARMVADTRTALERLGVPLDPRRTIRGLRTGEQQIVEIARALTQNARLLLLDEPTSALADAEIERLMALLEGLRRDGVTIIYVSHKLPEVFRLADRITVLRDGTVVGSEAASEMDAARLIGLMAGRELAAETERESATAVLPDAAPALEVEGLSLIASGAERGLSDLSFTLRQGEVLGVAGLMGAGRTELLETLFGASPRRKVRWRKFVVGASARRPQRQTPFATPGAALRGGLALVTEDRKLKSLALPLSVRHNMTLSSLKAFTRSGWIAEKRERATVNDEITRLRIKTNGGDVAIGGLSGGNQQKVVLARCLLTRPQILLLDEPTRGIDVSARAEIYRLIQALAKEGVSVLLASSELPELLAVCDRILVLSEGRLAATFDRSEATQEGILQAAIANVRGMGEGGGERL